MAENARSRLRSSSSKKGQQERRSQLGLAEKLVEAEFEREMSVLKSALDNCWPSSLLERKIGSSAYSTSNSSLLLIQVDINQQLGKRLYSSSRSSSGPLRSHIRQPFPVFQAKDFIFFHGQACTCH